MPRNTAASKIGNGVISLLWQLRCHCNPDHNKFSSLSNTTVVSIFPNLCLWRRSLRSNLGGIGLEKLYRATINYTFFAVNCLFISHDFRRHIIAERSIRNIIKSACSRYSQNAIKRNMVDLFLCLVRTCILSSLFSSFLMTPIAVFFVCFFKCHCWLIFHPDMWQPDWFSNSKWRLFPLKIMWVWWILFEKGFIGFEIRRIRIQIDGLVI